MLAAAEHADTGHYTTCGCSYISVCERRLKQSASRQPRTRHLLMPNLLHLTIAVPIETLLVLYACTSDHSSTQQAIVGVNMRPQVSEAKDQVCLTGVAGPPSVYNFTKLAFSLCIRIASWLLWYQARYSLLFSPLSVPLITTRR